MPDSGSVTCVKSLPLQSHNFVPCWLSEIRTVSPCRKSHLPFNFSELGDPSDDVCAWMHLIPNFPVQWKQLVRCLDSTFSPVFSLSQCVSHVPDFVCQECLQLGIQRSFFSKRALDMYLLKAHGHRPSIGQYMGLITDVQYVTSRLLSDTLLLPMPLVPNRALEPSVRAVK